MTVMTNTRATATDTRATTSRRAQVPVYPAAASPAAAGVGWEAPVRGRSRPAGQPRLPLSAVRRPVPQAARDLLADAGRGLGRAIRAELPTDRYAAAHLAALRGAAALLATKARPGRGRQASAWDLLAKLAPEFAEWSAFFAAGSAKRQAAEAGIARLVSPREADDMVRQCAAFLDLVEAAL